ncbi:hypothetical protein D3C76_1881410 [compost metagenome]
MLRIAFDLDTPVERCTRYRQILEPWFDEIVDHLVFTRFRLDEIRVFLVEFQ